MNIVEVLAALSAKESSSILGKPAIIAHPSLVRSWSFEAPAQQSPTHYTVGDDQIVGTIYGLKIVSSPLIPPDKVLVVDERARQQIADQLLRQLDQLTMDCLLYGKASLAERFQAAAQAGADLARRFAIPRHSSPRRAARRAHRRRIKRSRH